MDNKSAAAALESKLGVQKSECKWVPIDTLNDISGKEKFRLDPNCPNVLNYISKSVDDQEAYKLWLAGQVHIEYEDEEMEDVSLPSANYCLDPVSRFMRMLNDTNDYTVIHLDEKYEQNRLRVLDMLDEMDKIE